MKLSKFKLIKGLLLTSMASLMNLGANAAPKSTPVSLDLNFGLTSDPEKVDKAKSKVWKNVYKIKSDGSAQLIAGHRSHSSHRSSRGGHYSHSSSSSHRSHSSHRSSGGGSHYSHSSSSSYSTPSSVYTPPAKTYRDYSLGDRTISRGTYGSDVDQLVTKLVQKKYLRSASVTQNKGYASVDATVDAAIRHFQKDAGLTVNGSVNSSVVTALNSWDENKTTIPLGFRPLSEGVAGNDVNELVILLQKAGYAPDPTKLETNSYGFYKYTPDIAMAVSVFQSYNALPISGNADDATISKLRAVAK